MPERPPNASEIEAALYELACLTCALSMMGANAARPPHAGFGQKGAEAMTFIADLAGDKLEELRTLLPLT